MLHRILIIAGLLCLGACTLLQNPSDNRKAMCKEIRHRMIFSGATADTTQAAWQRADYGRLNQMYRNEACMQ